MRAVALQYKVEIVYDFPLRKSIRALALVSAVLSQI
jgi:hypothetical protein